MSPRPRIHRGGECRTVGSLCLATTLFPGTSAEALFLTISLGIVLVLGIRTIRTGEILTGEVIQSMDWDRTTACLITDITNVLVLGSGSALADGRGGPRSEEADSRQDHRMVAELATSAVADDLRSLMQRDPSIHRLAGTFAILFSLLVASTGFAQSAPREATPIFKIGHFQIDGTIPIGHRCMGVLPQKSTSVADNLELHGFVLLGSDFPIVVVAIDWCEIRNASYDQWRTRLANAAGTVPQRVLVSSLHQHDAPVIDAGAQDLLDEVGLTGELFDREFHEDVLVRAEQALRLAIEEAIPVTHVGYAETAVREVASNRRVVDGAGKVSFARGSSSGREAFFRDADAGLIDPLMRTISFWDGDRCVVEYHAYATHPMSYYGRGEVSSDFVGLARKQLARLDRSIHPIYASGCSGDVTAGKYNDGTPKAREELTQKIYDAMLANRAGVRKTVCSAWGFRSVALELEYTRVAALQYDVMDRELRDGSLPTEKRILAAMGLASWDRAVVRKQPIDVPCIDFGIAKLVLFPGETFVGYQPLAQGMGGVPVIPVGYGESWTGYVPTDAAFADGFDESWLWVAPGAQTRINDSLRELLTPGP